MAAEESSRTSMSSQPVKTAVTSPGSAPRGNGRGAPVPKEGEQQQIRVVGG
jgi:hypothetical protein